MARQSRKRSSERGASRGTNPARERWNAARDKQAVIVDVSRELFERDGIAATSVTRIANEVGITRELFYYYFTNRSCVVEKVLDGYVEGIVEKLNQVIAANDDDDMGNILAVVEIMRGFMCEGEDLHPSPQRRVITESHDSNYFITHLSHEIAGYMASSPALKGQGVEPPIVFVEFCLMGVFGLLEVHTDLEPYTLSNQFKELVPKIAAASMRDK